MELLKYLSKPEIAALISIIGLSLTFFGAIASIVSIKSALNQKKNEHAYNVLLDAASKEWTANHTQAELEKMNNELKNLTYQISNDIPKQARRIFLQYKFDVVRNEIMKLYVDYQNINRELKDLENLERLDENIEAFINDDLRSMTKGSSKNVGLVTLIILLLFLSLPFGGDIVYYFLRGLIRTSGAHLQIGHVTSYSMLLIIVTYLSTLIKNKKLNCSILSHKKFSLLFAFSLLTLWLSFIYIVSFDIFYRSFAFQSILAFASTICFALSYKIITLIFKAQYN